MTKSLLFQLLSGTTELVNLCSRSSCVSVWMMRMPRPVWKPSSSGRRLLFHGQLLLTFCAEKQNSFVSCWRFLHCLTLLASRTKRKTEESVGIQCPGHRTVVPVQCTVRVRSIVTVGCSKACTTEGQRKNVPGAFQQCPLSDLYPRNYPIRETKCFPFRGVESVNTYGAPVQQ